MTIRQPLPLLYDDESGETVDEIYQPWFVPDNFVFAVTPSQQMVLGVVVDLFEDDELTEAQAKLTESAFFLNGWTWADAPDKAKPTLQQQIMRELLMKTEDDDDGELTE